MITERQIRRAEVSAEVYAEARRSEFAENTPMRATLPITISVGSDELAALRSRASTHYGAPRWVGKVVRDAIRHYLALPRQTTIDKRLAEAVPPRWCGVAPLIFTRNPTENTP